MAYPPRTNAQLEAIGPGGHAAVAQDLTDLNDNGRGWATSLAQRFTLGETMLPSPIVKSGRYYGPSAYSTSVTVAATSGRIYLVPFYLPTSTAFDRITVNCTTLLASTTGRCGVYAPDATTLLPSTLSVDGGTVSGATTGLKETVVSVTLSGLVYFAFVADGATWSAVTNGQVPNVFGSSSGSFAASAVGFIYDQGAGITTLPATLTAGTLTYNGSSPATGMLRAV